MITPRSTSASTTGAARGAEHDRSRTCLEELAVNKLLALFSRAEARDFVDFAAVEPLFGLDLLCRLAADKDVGFDRRVLAEMLDRIERLPDDEFQLSNERLAALRRSVLSWHLQLVRPGRGRGRGRKR